MFSWTQNPQWGLVLLADRVAQRAIPRLPGSAGFHFAGDGGWYRTTPFIMRDTTFYVDPSSRDDPPKFSILAKALECLNNYHIFAGATVTVELSDGTYRIDDVIKFEHPQAQQVRITGVSPRQRIGFAEIKKDGDDLILKVESIKGLSVGMSIITQGEGQFWNYHPGGHTIKHIKASYVRVSRSLLNQGPWWAEYKGLSAYLYYYKTKIDCPNSGLFLPNGIGRLSRMSMHGHWVPSLITVDEPVFKHHGVFTYDRAFFSDLIVSNFLRGITVRYHHFDLNFVAVYNCRDGIMVDCDSCVTMSGNLYCNESIGQGIYLHQAQAQIGSSQYYSHSAIVYLKGNGMGLLSSGVSHSWTNNVLIQFNAVGMITYQRGSVIFGNGLQPNHINANTSVDILAMDGGFIRGNYRGGSAGNCNPPNRIVGNNQAYIVVD